MGENMKIENDDMVVFHTRSPFFEKERDGLKRNTVRNLKATSYETMISSLFLIRKIKIINSETEDSFERTLTDVSYFEERFIFSWA